MNAIFDDYAGQVVPIRYHTWWPNSNDPFYLFNPIEDSLRVRYYCCPYPWNEYLYVPSFRFDGKYLGDPSDTTLYDFPTLADWYAHVRNMIDSLLAVPSPIRIRIVEDRQEYDSVYVSFDVVAVDSVPANLRLYLVVTEWKHRYPYPVGPHMHAFRDFIPGSAGYVLSMSINDSLRFDWAYPVDPEYRRDRLVTNIIVQNPSGRQILQGAREELPDPAIVDLVDTPQGMTLARNVPNPFNAETKISYGLSRGGKVRLSVFSPTGRLVTDLVNRYVEGGPQSVTWNGRDRFGREVGSGVYYYRLETDEGSLTGKMVLLR